MMKKFFPLIAKPLISIIHGKMMLFFVETWLKHTGMQNRMERNQILIRQTDAATTMSFITRLLGTCLLLTSLTIQAETNEMSNPDIPPTVQATAEQQALIMRLIEIGTKWITGKMTYDQVKQTLGQPVLHFELSEHTVIDDIYQPDKIMVITFRWYREESGEERIGKFLIQIQDNVNTNIPYQKFDHFGFKRVEHGKPMEDGIRTENAYFFIPSGVISIYRPINYISFNYRFPLSPDSLFDVYMTTDYVGEWTIDHGPWTLDKLRSANNLRGLAIARIYLMPEQLRNRESMKRYRYGKMRLCTGMICPETGIWEGWSPNGPTTQMKIAAGQPFPEVRAIAPDVQWYTSFVAGTWMWLKKDFS